MFLALRVVFEPTGLQEIVESRPEALHLLKLEVSALSLVQPKSALPCLPGSTKLFRHAHTPDRLSIPMIEWAPILFSVFRGGMQTFHGGAEGWAALWLSNGSPAR